MRRLVMLGLAGLVLVIGCGGDDEITNTDNPVCQVSPAALDFGTVPVDSTRTLTLAITNTGSGTLAGAVSESCGSFSVTSGGGGYSLAANESRTVTVQFAPADTGSASCSLATGSDLCGVVHCTGRGAAQAPHCEVRPEALDFGSVEIGSERELTFTIRNTGAGTLAGSVLESCGAYSISSGSGPYSLGADDSVRVTVRFAPQEAGTVACEVGIGGVGCAPVLCTGQGTSSSGTGACCLSDQSCVVLTDAACVAQGGAYEGDRALCAAWEALPMTGYVHETGKGLGLEACGSGRIYGTAGTNPEEDTVPGTPVEVWDFDGVRWTLLNTPGFGDANNERGDRSPVAIYHDSVYVGANNNATGAEIWRYHPAAGWRQVNTDGFGAGGTPLVSLAEEMAVYQDRLYVVTVKYPYSGIAVWRYDGHTWEDTGFDDGGRNELGDVPVVYHGLLYMGTHYSGAGGELWVFDGSTWSPVRTGGLGDPGNAHVVSLVVYDDALFIGTVNEDTGGEVWRYDGTVFTQINPDGFGDEKNIAALPFGVRDGRLVAGVYNADDVECGLGVWDGGEWFEEAICPFTPGSEVSGLPCDGTLYLADDGQVWKQEP